MERQNRLRTGANRVWGGFLVLGIALFFVTREGGMAAPEGAAILVLAFLGAGLVTYDIYSGPASAGTIFVLVLGLFHTGLLLAYSISGGEALIGGGRNSWVSGDHLRPAVLATTVGCVALALGYQAFGVALQVLESKKEARVLIRPRLVLIGSTIFVLGLGLIAPVLLQAGADAGYGEFLEASGDSYYGYGRLLLSMGVLFLVQAGGRARTVCCIVTIPLAIFLLFLGTRGSVLFLAAATVFVIGKTFRFRWRWFALGIPGALGVISVIRQTRHAGLSGLLAGEWDFLPLEGLAEMGYSLYPVVVVSDWMERGLEPWYGASLVVVPLRFLELLLGRTSPSPDMRYFNVEVGYVVGQIGGSPIAESLRNGGIPFVVLVMFILGLTLAFIQSRSTSFGILVAAVLLLPIMFFARNSFAPVPAQIFIGVALVWMASSSASKPRKAALRP